MKVDKQLACDGVRDIASNKRATFRKSGNGLFGERESADQSSDGKVAQPEFQPQEIFPLRPNRKQPADRRAQQRHGDESPPSN